MYRRVIACILACLLLTTFAACGESKTEGAVPADVQVEETAPEETPAVEVVPEPIVEEPVPVPDDFIVPGEGVRPVAVMIDNEGSRVLPQGGLDKAQIVYEVVVEGGLTRLMPVFWGMDPEMIGPVRSSRDYFLDYSMEYDAIYVHFGWSPQAQADIPKLKINNINGLYVGNDVIWDLTKEKGNWQDSYTSMEKLLGYAQKKKYATTTQVKFPFSYNATAITPESGEAASIVTLKYPEMTSKYEYDSETGLYKRFRYGKPHMERVSGKQLETRNIIVQYVPNYSIKGDKAGRQEMDTTGNGSGYFITGGKAVKIKWSKESRRAQTKYTDEAGNLITLNRGQTWIQIMPTTAKVTIE